MATATRHRRQRTPKRNRLKAMEHALRAQLLRLLVERGEASPAELARALGAKLSDVCYHVRRLEELDCAEQVRTRPVRGAVEHFYRATERHLIDFDEWEDLDPMVGEELLCEFMQEIVDDFGDSLKAKIVGSDRNFHITRTPLMLDDEGYQRGMEAFERCRLAMEEIEKESAERRAASGAPAIPTSAGLAFFKVPRSSFKG